jgi:hypothetical protein
LNDDYLKKLFRCLRVHIICIKIETRNAGEKNIEWSLFYLENFRGATNKIKAFRNSNNATCPISWRSTTGFCVFFFISCRLKKQVTLSTAYFQNTLYEW